MKPYLLLFWAFFNLCLPASAQESVLEAPAGFDEERTGIAHGKIDSISYASATVGTTRKALVYLPPDYGKREKLPVLYLLHGIGGDEKEWLNGGKPHVILDNLYAAGQLERMLVVIPNGRAMRDDRDIGNIFAPDKVEAFATFEQDLLNDLIPAGIPVEFHLYKNGGHGFGLGNPDRTSNRWFDAFAYWLEVNGFLDAKSRK